MESRCLSRGLPELCDLPTWFICFGFEDTSSSKRRLNDFLECFRVLLVRACQPIFCACFFLYKRFLARCQWFFWYSSGGIKFQTRITPSGRREAGTFPLAPLSRGDFDVNRLRFNSWYFLVDSLTMFISLLDWAGVVSGFLLLRFWKIEQFSSFVIKSDKWTLNSVVIFANRLKNLDWFVVESLNQFRYPVKIALTSYVTNCDGFHVVSQFQ